MMKKIALAGALLASATSLNAESHGFTGFQGGILLGAGSLNTTVKATAQGVTTTAPWVTPNGFNIGVSLLYGMQFNNLYVGLGLEGGKNFESVKHSTSGGGADTSSTTSQNYNFAVGPRVGVVMKDAMPFLELAYQYNALSYSPKKDNAPKALNAIRGGLGIDMKAAPHVVVGIRGTYAYCLSTKTKDKKATISGNSIGAAVSVRYHL